MSKHFFFSLAEKFQVWATYGGWKINFKHPQTLEEATDLTFIENGPVIFESINLGRMNIHFQLYNPTSNPWKSIKYSAI